MSLDPSSVPFLRSCERCRQKKRKCSGDRPTCRWCQDHHLQCKYRRTMRFKKQLQDTEALAELSTPMNLQQQPTDNVSADALAQLLSVDMVPSHATPLPQDLLQMANSFMNPFPNSTVQSNGGLLDNLGGLLTSVDWQTADTKDWIPVQQNESMNLLDDILMFSPSSGDESGTPVPPAPIARGLPEQPASDAHLDIGTDGIPNILKEYVKRIPGQPSASAIYQIMRETFKAPRMGMVSLNIELLWYSLHCGVLPRIVFYGNLACTLRCSVVSTLDIQALVPPDIDESCYQLALAEVPLIKGCREIWGAIGLCMVARYECHSARYKEMAEHAGMALEVMRRVKYQRKYEYPWREGVKEKEEFGYQYLLVVYWKCFLWKLMSLLLIERRQDWRELEKELEQLPDYSSKTFDLYTVDHAYDVSLMEMIPPDSWHGSRDLEDLRFRGPNDSQFMSIRPEGSPSFRRSPISGRYMQRLMVIYSRMLVQKLKVRCHQLSLVDFLRDLTVFKEHMRSWRYTLPSELVLDQRMMSEYQDLIRSGSTATWQDIDLRASKLKDVIVLLMTYHMFLVRANRFALKLMLDEPLDRPPPDILTEAFAIRDLYDTTRESKGLGHLNFFFQGCRIEAIRSSNALCSLTQAANACKFNFYTLGPPIIFAVFELLVVSVGLLKNRDGEIRWRAKGRLSNVFNILRRLRHWAPALHMFVGGIRSLSEPRLCLVEPSGMGDVRDPAGGEMDNGNMYMLGVLEANGLRQPQVEEEVRRDETLAYRAADPIPEFPNPFPPAHVISLIVRDLDLSLAQFLAPAYPVLLLKLMPGDLK